MTRYNTLNLKLSNPQLNELKSGIQNGTQMKLNVFSNMVGDCNI